MTELKANELEVTVLEEVKYTMRPLKTKDVFRMSKILKKIDMELKIDENTTQTQLGVQLAQRVVENIYMAEEEVNAFLADLIGIKAEEFENLPIEKTIEIITLFKEQKGIMNFLKLAGKQTI